MKLDWAIPPNSKAPLVIRIGNQTFRGVATELTKTSIRMKIGDDSLGNFLNHFEADSKMYIIIFKSSNEHPWYANLNGASDAILWINTVFISITNRLLRHNILNLSRHLHSHLVRKSSPTRITSRSLIQKDRRVCFLQKQPP